MQHSISSENTIKKNQNKEVFRHRKTGRIHHQVTNTEKNAKGIFLAGRKYQTKT